MFEGTGKYFLLLFLIFVIVYITKKICLYFLFKNAKEKPYKALIPIYTTKVLVDLLNMKKSIFYLCLIPGVNLFYYHQIYKQLLLGFGQNEKETIWFDLIPMYKFPELVFKNPRFILNEYDLTSAFIESQNALFEKPKEELPDKIELVNLADKIDEYNGQKASNDIIIEPTKYEQIPDISNIPNESASQNLEAPTDINSNHYEEMPVINDIYSYQNTNDTNLWNVSNEPKIEEPVLETPEIKVEDTNNNYGDSVFTNKSLEPDERHEKIVIAEKKEEKEKNPIDPYHEGRPQMCPNCGAKLASGATTCFLCGTKLK